MWDFTLEGRVFDIHGRKLQIEEQLTEVLDRNLGQRQVLARVKNMDSKVQSLLKIRYQLNPKDFDFEDPGEVQEFAEEHYCYEVQAIKLLAERGLGPKYFAHETQDQEEWMPFPGGYVDFIAMQLPPGEDVDEIQDELTNRQLDSIRTQLAYILEMMRKNGYKLVQQHPSYLNYDAQTNKLYLMDLAALDFTDPKTSFAIDEESPYVEAFNIWRAPYSKPAKGPTSGGMPPDSTREKDPKPGRMPPSDQFTKKENKPPWRG